MTKPNMNTEGLAFLVLAGITLTGVAQQPPTLEAELAGVDPKYEVTDRGPHHKVWSRVTSGSNDSGGLVLSTNSVIELATGMHFLQDGKWVPSREQIEPFPAGAVARHGQSQVIFANNLATPGAIDMQAPDGKRFQSHILGLSYLDAVSG